MNASCHLRERAPARKRLHVRWGVHNGRAWSPSGSFCRLRRVSGRSVANALDLDFQVDPSFDPSAPLALATNAPVHAPTAPRPRREPANPAADDDLEPEGDLDPYAPSPFDPYSGADAWRPRDPDPDDLEREDARKKGPTS